MERGVSHTGMHGGSLAHPNVLSLYGVVELYGVGNATVMADLAAVGSSISSFRYRTSIDLVWEGKTAKNLNLYLCERNEE